MSAPLGAAPERIWLAVEAVDMRLGIDGLSARIQASLGRSPCDGTAYAFTNRRRSRLKLLVWDGTGVWLSQRRLHRGYFTWPSASDPVFALTAAQWRWLIAGVDWQRRDAPHLPTGRSKGALSLQKSMQNPPLRPLGASSWYNPSWI
jgi:transposase